MRSVAVIATVLDIPYPPSPSASLTTFRTAALSATGYL